jgi:hypothetical protein
MTILFTAIFSGIAMLFDRQFGFLKETLVAPVPRIEVMIGRTLGGATVASIQGTLIFVVCLIAGFRPAHLALVPLAFLFMGLIAVVFAALGTVFGSIVQDMQGFQLIMNFMVLPIFYLSGALFPLTNLPRPLAIITRLDPLTYGVDALGGAINARTGLVLDVSCSAPRRRLPVAGRICFPEFSCSTQHGPQTWLEPEARRPTKVVEAARPIWRTRHRRRQHDVIAENRASAATIYKHWQDKDALALEALSLMFGLDEEAPNLTRRSAPDWWTR